MPLLSSVGNHQVVGTVWTMTQRLALWCHKGGKRRDRGENTPMNMVRKHNLYTLYMIKNYMWWTRGSVLKYVSVLFLMMSRVGGRQNGYSSRAVVRGGPEYDSCSSFMSSELESTSCFDSEDDDATSRSDILCETRSEMHTWLEECNWNCILCVCWQH